MITVRLVLGWGGERPLEREWKEVCYKGHTLYATRSDSSGTWLHAEAEGQNSALFHPLRLLVHGVTLRWRWRVLRQPAGADPDVRARDDRAAAVLVLVHRSFLPWRTKGLLYQWARARNHDTWTSSPYAASIKVITLEDAASDGTWRMEQRDLEADLREAFGAVPRSIEAIGVLCDADNTNDRAVADFGPLEVMMDGKH